MEKHEIEDFLGVFPNSVSSDYCEALINFFERGNHLNRVLNRQQHEMANPLEKDTNQLYFEEEMLKDEYVMKNSNHLIGEFTSAFWKNYNLYAEKYGIIKNISQHMLCVNGLRIQKTLPSGGYHIWHCEHDSSMRGNRLMLVLLYLNDVEEGGETEFLYQSKRIKAKKGTMIICPSSYTHTHRGNPPLKGNKYIANTWAVFTQ